MENSDNPPQIAAEQTATKEKVLPANHWAGLQPRLLLTGESLNPDKTDLPPITPESLATLEGRDYGVFNGVSRRERKDYWRGKEDGDFDRQRKVWIDQTASVFTNAHKFFQEGEKGKLWSQTLSLIGINTTQFSTMDEARAQAEALYDKYFTSDNKQSNIKAFVKDLIDSSPSPLSPDNLQAIQWLSNIFGQTSSEIITQLADAEAKLKIKPQTLIDQANQTTAKDGQETARINNLNEDERRLLGFLWGEGELQTTTETTTPPPTQTPAIERPPQQEQTVPNVNVGENIRAADQFIQTLRDPKRYKEDPNDNRFLIHDFGYIVEKSPLENVWFSTQSLEIAERRYKLPLAILLEANHAMLLLKAPYKGADGNWRILIYNPFKEGEEERILPDYEKYDQTDIILTDPQGPEQYKTRRRLELNNIRANNLAVAQIHQGQYDISISGNPQLKPYQDTFMRGKLAALQQDTKNCIPYCHFVAALLNALKPGDSEFKRNGIPQFTKDFGIIIKTLEEIISPVAG